MKTHIVLIIYIIAFILSFHSRIFADSEDMSNFESSSKLEIFSPHLKSNIVILPGVCFPYEAEGFMLPYIDDHKLLFKNKTVLDIGTGSGIIGLYAAQLGAKKVIATDIDENAIASAKINAKKLGLSNIFEARLVPVNDISAYSVIKTDEKFDVIISNPPYSLDLDASKNSPGIDKGDLGMSIIKGLYKHLEPTGITILLYRSFFYHYVIVKFARYEGYDVTHYPPKSLSPWEEDTLFNSYLKKLLESYNLPPNSFKFDWRQDNRDILNFLYKKPGPYSGLIIISRPKPKKAVNLLFM